MKATRDDRGRPTLVVLVIGATGTFGERLVRHLAREPGLRIVPAARRPAPLLALAASLGLRDTLAIDRATIDAATLRERCIDLVIDASGPFLRQSPSVVVAAIEAGAHYLDLADGRDFVTDIGRFDAAARRAGVAVVSGASSTPALSHAVVDTLCADWRRIDTLGATICPSNRQRVGLAVVRSILSTVGRPVRVFDQGRWTTSRGWSRTRRFRFPGIGRRYASLVETPDLDLFVSRYRPTTSATFEAGLGLPVEHLALAAIGTLVRLGLPRSAAPLARPLHALGNRLRHFGVDVGVMEVRAEGLDARGSPTRARWRLRASGESGPHVPTLAALALTRHLRDGTLGPAPDTRASGAETTDRFGGARPCVGLLTLDDFADDLARLGVTTSTDVRTEVADPGVGEAPPRPSPAAPSAATPS